MIRLTYKEPNGNFGVAGMNEQNQNEKLYMCVLKLLKYEELGLNPSEVERLIYENADLMKENQKLKANVKELEEANAIIKKSQSISHQTNLELYDKCEKYKNHILQLKSQLQAQPKQVEEFLNNLLKKYGEN